MDKRGFTEDHTISNSKLGLGFLAAAIALCAQFYPQPYPDNRVLLAVCVAAFCVIQLGLTYIQTYVQGELILQTKVGGLAFVIDANFCSISESVARPRIRTWSPIGKTGAPCCGRGHRWGSLVVLLLWQKTFCRRNRSCKSHGPLPDRLHRHDPRTSFACPLGPPVSSAVCFPFLSSVASRLAQKPWAPPISMFFSLLVSAWVNLLVHLFCFCGALNRVAQARTMDKDAPRHQVRKPFNITELFDVDGFLLQERYTYVYMKRTINCSGPWFFSKKLLND